MPKREVKFRKDGEAHEGHGLGPTIPYDQQPLPTAIQVMAKNARPLDLADAYKRGLIDQSDVNWDPKDPNSNWRTVGGYRKLTPERKGKFLEVLELTGRIGLAARAAGVAQNTVRDHRKADPLFNEACTEAEQMYHEVTAGLILAQARQGMKDIRYDKEGNLLCERTTYETQIRKLMLERADESYRMTQKQQLEVTGGAVVVPAPEGSVESWEDVVKRHTGAVSRDLAADGTAALTEGRVVRRPGADEPVDTVGESSPDGAEVDEQSPSVPRPEPTGD